MGQIQAITHHHRNLNPPREVGSIAMWVTMISFAMLFATLFLSYALYRSSVPVWPPLNRELINLSLPTLNTFILALSSLSYCLYQRAYGQRHWGQTKLWWSMTLFLGLLFFLFQFKFWGHLKAAGFFAHTNIFTSLIYGFTWIHAAHVVGGIGALLSLFVTLRQGERSWLPRISHIGVFWHFLGIVWFIIYLGLFVF